MSSFGMSAERRNTINTLHDVTNKNYTIYSKHQYDDKANIKNSLNNTKRSDIQEFSDAMYAYISDVLNRESINIAPGIKIERKTNYVEGKSFDTSLISKIKHFTNNHVVSVNLARASTETGRLFFFKGKSFSFS
jgi:hypothetical protein